MPFREGWSNARLSLQGNELDGPPVRFYKDNDSIVWMDGVIQRARGAHVRPAFTLRPGYRPAFKVTFGTEPFGTIEVRPNGEVWAIGEWTFWKKYPNSVYVSGNGGPYGVPSRLVFSLNFYSFRAAS